MKILFSSWPAYGHLLPMIPLARAAQRAGHTVLISSGPDLRAIIERRGFAAHQAGPTLAKSYEIARASQPGDQRQFSEMTPQESLAAAGRWLFGASAVRRAQDLSSLLADFKPDLVIHDVLEFGSPTAAESLGIPHLSHSYGPIVPGSEFFAAVVGGTLTQAGLLDPVPSIMRSPYLDVCPPRLQPQGTSPWATCSPLRPSAGEVDPGDQLPARFVDLPHDTTIYLTLGTITNQRPEVFRTVLEGCCRLPINVVTTTGPGVDPADLGTQPDNVVVLPYLPQALLLPHCDGVISHAGAGTMLGGLCFGLPQLCLPQGTDQPYNAAALVGTGAGLAITPDEITPDTIAAALGRLLDEPGFRGAARTVQAEIAAMPTPELAVRNVLGPAAAG